MIKSSPDERMTFNNDYEIIDYISSLVNKADAWNYTALRLEDAHKYVEKYCKVEGWGKNVWHTILEDAIRMRKLYEPGEIK